MVGKKRQLDMMKDFIAFNLRKEDYGYEAKLKYYGDISERYTLIDLNSSGTSDKSVSLSNLLDDIYDLQLNPPSFPRRGNPNYRYRDQTEILVSLSIEQSNGRSKYLRERLVKSIKDKEDTEQSLNEHYQRLTSQHGSLSLLPFAFYLSYEWVEQHKNLEKKSPQEALKLSTEELKRRFDKIIKKMKSNKRYTPVCGYSRLILVDEDFRPFYLVNFFFEGGDLNHLLISDIWNQWLESRPTNEMEDEQCGCFYYFESQHKPCSNDVPGLVMRSPGNKIRHFENEGGILSDEFPILFANYIPRFKKLIVKALTNTPKGHKAFFQLQAMRFNTLGNIRAISFSDDLTYRTAKEKKEKSEKRKANKEDVTNTEIKKKNKVARD